MTTSLLDIMVRTQLWSTLLLTGLVWFVQLVHYPLMARVGQAAFVRYEQEHTRRTSWIVAPLMLLELGTAIWLSWQPPYVSWVWGFNLAGVLALWGSTFLIQVPLHNRLSSAFDADVHRRLVATNWVRTVIWTLRSMLLLASV